MLENELVVYLAGRFMRYSRFEDWRDCIKDRVAVIEKNLDPKLARRIRFIDPRANDGQGRGFAGFCYLDREGVLDSDVVFFFDVTPSGVQEDPGSVNEATIGAENGKTVIFCTEMSVIHPMFGNYCSGAIAIGLDAGIEWLFAFAKHGTKSLEAYHEVIEARKWLLISGGCE